MRTIKLFTLWRDGQENPVCVCPPQNRCSKDRGCELTEYTYDNYRDVKHCMSKQRVYKKVKGRIREVE